MLHYFKLVGLALLLSVGVGSVGQAASFDCNKATTETEIAICSDPELSALDAKLSRLWKGKYRSATEIEGQKNWLEIRNSFESNPVCMSNSRCIKKHYIYRNLELITDCDIQIEVPIHYENIPTLRGLDEILSASNVFEECRKQKLYEISDDFEKLSDLISSISIEGCAIYVDAFIYPISQRRGHYVMSRCSGNVVEHYEVLLAAMETLILRRNIDEKKLYVDQAKWKAFADQACSFYETVFVDGYLGNLSGSDKCKADVIKSRIINLSPLIGVDEFFGWPAGSIDEVLGDNYGEYKG